MRCTTPNGATTTKTTYEGQDQADKRAIREAPEQEEQLLLPMLELLALMGLAIDAAVQRTGRATIGRGGGDEQGRRLTSP